MQTCTRQSEEKTCRFAKESEVVAATETKISTNYSEIGCEGQAQNEIDRQVTERTNHCGKRRPTDGHSTDKAQSVPDRGVQNLFKSTPQLLERGMR